jgi:hypothetical protein
MPKKNIWLKPRDEDNLLYLMEKWKLGMSETVQSALYIQAKAEKGGPDA